MKCSVRRRFGLRARLSASHALLALALVVVAAVGLESMFGALRRSDARTGAERDADVLAARSAHLVDRPDRWPLDAVVRDEARASRRAEVVDENGRRLAGGVPTADAAAVHDAVSAALEGLTDSRVTAGGRVVVAAAPIVRRDDLVGVGVVIEPAPGIAFWRGPLRMAAGLGLLLVVLAGSAGWLVAGPISRRLRELASTAHDLALGDVHRSVPTASAVPEVETLSAAVARLGERVRRLTDAAHADDDRAESTLRRLSHQMRTPLSVLTLRLDALRDGDIGARRRADLVAVVASAVDELEQVSSRLSEIARRDGVAPRATVVAVDAVVSGVCTRLGPLARWSNVDLRVRTDPCTVSADADGLDEAIANLVENAVKFAGRRATVDVRCHCLGGDVVIEVEDDGPGVPPAERALVVAPWTRGSAAIARGIPGSGVGLSVAADVAKAAGGRLELDGARGGGLLARLVLPAAAA